VGTSELFFITIISNGKKLKLKFYMDTFPLRIWRRYLSYFEYISSASCGWGVLFPAIRGRYYLSFLNGFEESMQYGRLYYSRIGEVGGISKLQ
jgi:hypothetical protein